ncbi:unnamed protein product [Dibothriocephalus latus]|uniref:Cadherin domain-containing protein n=1 Tax=Dibothriocephalus latus TaxID=60516 RepID=A0A3P6SF26_DIBLA|nr:unnamed protein product [Dibothriocephalus latus]
MCTITVLILLDVGVAMVMGAFDFIPQELPFQPKFGCVVIVLDGAPEPYRLTSTALVHIELTDVNDEPPKIEILIAQNGQDLLFSDSRGWQSHINSMTTSQQQQQQELVAYIEETPSPDTVIAYVQRYSHLIADRSRWLRISGGSCAHLFLMPPPRAPGPVDISGSRPITCLLAAVLVATALFPPPDVPPPSFSHLPSPLHPLRPAIAPNC